MNLTAVTEGILFAVGDEGITLNTLSDVLDVDIETTKNILKELHTRYEDDAYGIRVTFLGDTFKLTTKKEHKDYYRKLLGNKETQTLSTTSLEVLAIIAYNQPITRIKIDELRGVASGHIVRKLCALGLIKISGKSDLPGKPNLYATTREFLDYFGLATIKDLPEVIMPEETEEVSDLFMGEYKDIKEENYDKKGE